MHVQSSAKQSVLKSPAALEIDFAGNLIGRREVRLLPLQSSALLTSIQLEQRIENLSQSAFPYVNPTSANFASSLRDQ